MPASVRAFLFKRAPESGLSYKVKKAGMSQLRMELIPHARHDIFHEKQSGAASQAMDILLSFLKPFMI